MLTLTPYRKSNHSALYNPFREMEDLERSFFGQDALASFRTDIEDAGDSFVLTADLPGFKKEDIHVDVEDDQLVISAQRHSNYEQKEKRGGYLRCERSYGTYSRSFSMEGIDTDHIKASYENGVLTLTLPKRTDVKNGARRLEIE